MGKKKKMCENETTLLGLLPGKKEFLSHVCNRQGFTSYKVMQWVPVFALSLRYPPQQTSL